MKLESISISGFRSIQELTLSECGQFNVLIGKNNAGKSTILSAIHRILQCINKADIITLDTAIAESFDFRTSTTPIDLTATFSINSDERSELISKITTDAPQMRNVVDSLPLELHLSTTIRILSTPRIFGYIRTLTLTDAHNKQTNHTLMDINDSAANELRERQQHINDSLKSADAIRQLMARFDHDDWERFRGDAKRSRVDNPPPLRFVLRHYTSSEFPEEVSVAVERALTDEKSFSDF